eukprot:COSAG01_NODE_2277_length_8010_cov_15.062571_7_plen_113_part_00
MRKSKVKSASQYMHVTSSIICHEPIYLLPEPIFLADPAMRANLPHPTVWRGPSPRFTLDNKISGVTLSAQCMIDRFGAWLPGSCSDLPYGADLYSLRLLDSCAPVLRTGFSL